MKIHLKYKFLIAVLILVTSICSMAMVTMAWYLYQTEASTSDIQMAVGTGNMLHISNQYNGEYGYTALADTFSGTLTPVSTNKITGGFQKVKGFVKGTGEGPKFLAHSFEASDSKDYYKTTLFLKATGAKQDIYISDIGYEDSDADNPISTAIRIGFVVYEAGERKEVAAEYIFAINTADNPSAEYNTSTGSEGYVLDCSKTDGTTVPMTNLYTSENFCGFEKQTGFVTVNENSIPLFTINEEENEKPVQIDVYIWLEGCDKDCTNNLCNTMLKNITLSFSGKVT